MPLVKCGRCNGTGHQIDKNPTTGELNWCAGCGGDGYVDALDPNVRCARCSGDGHHTDMNPSTGKLDWCAGCKGTGYAS